LIRSLDTTASLPAFEDGLLARWTFDLSGATDRFTKEYVDDISGEFPRIDDRCADDANPHGWYACAYPDGSTASRFSGIVHVDFNANRRAHYWLSAGDTVSEPVFVERTADAVEGDGW